MRSFIALEFNDNLKSRLNNIKFKLKDNSIRGSWVYKDNFHLTLKFLGDIDPQYVGEIDSTLQSISDKHDPIEMALSDIGFFRGKNEIRVVWVGMKGDLDSLILLNKTVQERMETLGFKKEKRKFTPHITLGRRVVFDTRLHNINELIKDDLNYKFKLDTISLMKSENIDNKRIYTPLSTYKLEKI